MLGMINLLWNLLHEKFLENRSQIISDGITTLTYGRLAEDSLRISTKLYQSQKYGILCKTELNTAKSIFACFAAGAVAVPLSEKYGITHCMKILDSVGIETLITDDAGMAYNLKDYSEKYFLLDSQKTSFRRLKKEEPELSDVAAIMCTSGTTGMPKGAMITEQNFYANLADIAQYFKIDQTDKILMCRPLYHCAVLTGELLISILNGLSIRFCNAGFNPFALSSIIENEKITVMCGTPTLFYHLSEFAIKRNKRLSLKTIAVSGECMTSNVAKVIRSAFPDTNIYNVYGLSEASPRVTYLKPDMFDIHPESVGLPLASVEAKIVDEKGEEVKENTDGELLIKGPNIMKGYYRNPERTRKILNNGWLHTGDMASRDVSGLITIKSRKDNMIIRAGMNIYPQEIENALKASPKIAEALAFASGNSEVSQKISIKVVPTGALTESELLKLCTSLLPTYQFPDSIEIVKNIPKNGSGKIMRPKAGACCYERERV